MSWLADLNWIGNWSLTIGMGYVQYRRWRHQERQTRPTIEITIKNTTKMEDDGQGGMTSTELRHIGPYRAYSAELSITNNQPSGIRLDYIRTSHRWAELISPLVKTRAPGGGHMLTHPEPEGFKQQISGVDLNASWIPPSQTKTYSFVFCRHISVDDRPASSAARERAAVLRLALSEADMRRNKITIKASCPA
ncbi:hypothetical protein FDP22_12495 [Paroceanicella profunda]|uniref:Uncharacterized protein n=1 Tax=Paroceanicella profunda TaxID=2579971 RepID=A0A5B8FHS3_9RHOB|nr:hypothetical protein [Paroceanicella profunda]QDL92527.1 hypothetical protein FDP22_12495 [Paroceanicella profunda]